MLAAQSSMGLSRSIKLPKLTCSSTKQTNIDITIYNMRLTPSPHPKVQAAKRVVLKVGVVMNGDDIPHSLFQDARDRWDSKFLPSDP